jgi:ketosteroid isomerase-like protein
MTTLTKTVSLADLKHAIEGRDANALAGFYAEDAVMLIVDQDNPPSQPRELRGRPAIAGYFEDVCGRAMTHKIEAGVADAAHLAFAQTCTYPDGKRVVCSAMIELARGKIARQTTLQVWDA